MTSISEIMGLSMLFVIPFVPIVSLVFAIYVWLCMSRKRKVACIFHWLDLLMPFMSTALWCHFQSHSFYTKSMGNLAEIGIIGLVWGGLFLIRSILILKNQNVPIWKFAVITCIVTMLLALFAPTFPE